MMYKNSLLRNKVVSNRKLSAFREMRLKEANSGKQ